MLFAFGCVAAEGLGELECLKRGPYFELMDNYMKHRFFFCHTSITFQIPDGSVPGSVVTSPATGGLGLASKSTSICMESSAEGVLLNIFDSTKVTVAGYIDYSHISAYAPLYKGQQSPASLVPGGREILRYLG